MSLSYMLALKNGLSLTEKFILGSLDLYHHQLQKWTSVEQKKHFYPFHQVSQLWNNPPSQCWHCCSSTLLNDQGSCHCCGILCCRKALSNYRNICWDMENTQHQSKKAGTGNLSSCKQQLEERRRSTGIAASGDHQKPAREYTTVPISPAVWRALAPSTYRLLQRKNSTLAKQSFLKF